VLIYLTGQYFFELLSCAAEWILMKKQIIDASYYAVVYFLTGIIMLALMMLLFQKLVLKTKHYRRSLLMMLLLFLGTYFIFYYVENVTGTKVMEFFFEKIEKKSRLILGKTFSEFILPVFLLIYYILKLNISHKEE